MSEAGVVAIRSKSDEEVVSILRRLLNEAEAGEISSVMVHAMHPGGGSSLSWAGAENRLLGRVAQLEEAKFMMLSKRVLGVDSDE